MSLIQGIPVKAFNIYYCYLRLHAAQYRTEETDHTEIFDNIDRFNGQFLQNCCYREQHCAAETKHIADKLVLSWQKTFNVNFFLAFFYRAIAYLSAFYSSIITSSHGIVIVVYTSPNQASHAHQADGYADDVHHSVPDAQYQKWEYQGNRYCHAVEKLKYYVGFFYSTLVIFICIVTEKWVRSL